MVSAQQSKGNYKIRISRTKKQDYQLKKFTRDGLQNRLETAETVNVKKNQQQLSNLKNKIILTEQSQYNTNFLNLLCNKLLQVSSLKHHPLLPHNPIVKIQVCLAGFYAQSITRLLIGGFGVT